MRHNPHVLRRAYETSKPRWQKRSPAVHRSRAESTGSGRRRLCCIRCGDPITDASARVERCGIHEHSQVNPHGFIWHFGCFARAPGCLALGPPTDHFSWFAGYRWQIAHCSGCDLHLGWRFEADGDRFWGLVLDRLIERASDSGPEPRP